MNSLMVKQKVSTVFSGTILFAFSIGFLCMSLLPLFAVSHADMGMGHVTIKNPPQLSVTSCCNKSSNDHIELWKNTFEGIPQNIYNILAFFTVALFASTFTGFFKLSRPTDTVLVQMLRQYNREHPETRLYNALNLAFARGLLHPKTF